MNEGKNTDEANKFKTVPTVYSDTSRNYLSRGYNGRNGSAKVN